MHNITNKKTWELQMQRICWVKCAKPTKLKRTTKEHLLFNKQTLSKEYKEQKTKLHQIT